MAESTSDKSADPVLAGIDRLRDTAKWLIGAYAAVGTVVIAGLQLASLGKVEDDTRLWVGIVAAAVALLAVMAGIAQVARVLAPITVEASDLAPDSDVDKMVKETPTLLKGQAPNLQSLQEEYAAAVTDYGVKRAAARADAAKRPEAEQAYREVTAMHDPLDRMRRIALFLRVQNRFDDAKQSLAIASVVVAFAVIAFAWAANPADESQQAAKAKESGPALAAPSAVTLSVDDDRGSLAPLRTKLGAACKLDAVAALVVGGTAAEPDVVTLPQDGCNAVRFTLSDGLGVALPATAAATPTGG